MTTNRVNIPKMKHPQAINLRDVKEIPGFGNNGGGGVPIHIGGVGDATADTGTPHFPQNRTNSKLL